MFNLTVVGFLLKKMRTFPKKNHCIIDLFAKYIRKHMIMESANLHEKT